MADDAATVEIGATSSRLDAGLRAAMAKVSRWAAGVQTTVAKAGGAIGKAGWGGAKKLAGGVADRGMDFLVDQAKAVYTFEESLARLQIAGTLSADAVGDVRDAATGASSATGVGRQKILEGAQAYVDLTGDVKGAGASMSTFARTAQATGAQVKDVSEAAAAFRGIGVDLGDMEGLFSGLATQGKAGAVSLKDFAGELASLAPRWAKFNESTTEGGLSELGAVFQVARQGFGSASEAATGMQALMGAMTGKAKAFGAAGVKLFDTNPKTGVRTLRTFSQIMTSIENSKLVKDPELMTKVLGSKEAEQTLTMLLKSRMAIDGQTTQYEDLIKAGMDRGAIERDLNTYLESSAGRMSTMWEGIQNKVASAFTPERIEAFVDLLGDAADTFGSIIDSIGDIKGYLDGSAAKRKNPFEEQAGKIDPDDSFLGKVGKMIPGVPEARAELENVRARAQRIRDARQDPNSSAGRALQNQAAFDESMAELEGGGRRKGIKRALEIFNQTGANAMSPGGLQAGDAGKEEAVRRYLASVLGEKNAEHTLGRETERQVGEARAKQLLDKFGSKAIDLLTKIAADEKSINIDGNNVATAVSKSTGARRKP